MGEDIREICDGTIKSSINSDLKGLSVKGRYHQFSQFEGYVPTSKPQ
jgi:hypothetical protein